MCGYIHGRFEDKNICISRRAAKVPEGLGLGFSSNNTSRWGTGLTSPIASAHGALLARAEALHR
jgi:hypothetical protein